MRTLTYIFILWAFGSFGQELKLQFTFVDAMTDAMVDSVEVKIYSSTNKLLGAQNLNNFEPIVTDFPTNQKVKIKAHKVSYYPIDTLVDLSRFQRSIQKGRVILIELVFRYDGQISGETSISAIYKPEISFSSEIISVSDFVVVNETTKVLLVYPKRLNAGSELIWFENDSIVARRIVPEKAIRLDTDYRNRIYLRCEYNDFQLKNDEFLTLVKVPRAQLDNYVKPILDTLQNKQLFFTTHKSHYPAFDFFKVSMNDTSHSVVHHIEDVEMMELYRAEYKWADVRTKLWAWDMEAETGIDREVWVGANVFTNSIYYEAPYSEFFLVGDEVLIFDFYKDYLYKYNANTGEKLDSSSIRFHKYSRKTGWERRLIQDPVTKNIYTMYDNAGYTDVYKIDLNTGERMKKATLFYRYVENVQVYNDELYYIYRPFESLQKKYLYKESSPLIFRVH
ncbi:hypothetical protein [Brumimicrobium oceani]|uniref:Uncharacterized protein n=1 Tax=Brumimicrobium oceani TaxID=2100725 RepID=A0A2U2X2B6_9FLAO|nr:hypothetical protein [Brumimicrobium oceani]PWH81894.1 hypothetical protein DIT68_14475 [Brumimicrobium oceani]